MEKRTVLLVSILLLGMSLLIVKLLTLTTETQYVETASTHGTYTLPLAETRGKIYDRNGYVLAGGSAVCRAVVIPSAETTAALFRSLDPETLASLEQTDDLHTQLKGSLPFVITVPDGRCQSDGIRVYRVPVRYAPDDTITHLIGTCGGDGGESGIEKAYDSWLRSASGRFRVTCRVNATGRSLNGAQQEVTDTTADSDRGVMLTIDHRIQTIAQSAASAHLQAGAVIVADVRTAEILAMVSLPTCRRNAVSDALNDPASPLINRALLPYNAGSVFKPVVAAAALENGCDPSAPCLCEGSMRIGQNVMGCISHQAHGEVDMNQALSHSCNIYFIQKAQQTGGEPILRMAEALGFGAPTRLGNHYEASAGTLPSAESLTRPAALANFSFGQGELTVTPVQVTAMMLAIAHDGLYREPTVVRGLTDGHGSMLSPSVPDETRQVMRPETAAVIRQGMRTAVEEGTAKAGAPDHTSAAAKTGTAETGIFRNGKRLNQAWYAGFFPYESPRYVCVVLAEGGLSGGGTAGPVFREIANRIGQILPDAAA